MSVIAALALLELKRTSGGFGSFTINGIKVLVQADDGGGYEAAPPEADSNTSQQIAIGEQSHGYDGYWFTRKDQVLE
jgi:hypothetical protein